jgi:hypothetical protein
MSKRGLFKLFSQNKALFACNIPIRAIISCEDIRTKGLQKERGKFRQSIENKMLKNSLKRQKSSNLSSSARLQRPSHGENQRLI